MALARGSVGRPPRAAWRASLTIAMAAAAGFWLAAAVSVSGAGGSRVPTGRRIHQAVPSPARETPSSVLDGVFTEEQAKRGHDVFASHCTECHGTALEGGTEAPALVGAAFVANWTGLTVGDLVERIQRTMPDSDPGSLSRQQYTDVGAFLLASNHYPAGKTDLPVDSDELKRIKIVAAK